MYLEQFKNNKENILKYLPFVLGFIGFMGLNLITSQLLNTDSAAMIDNSVKTLGKNFTFFSFLIPFTFFLALLLIWWKYIHKETFTRLTTGRKKIDWNRFFFSFTIWGLINAITLAITYFINPNNFELQFNPQAFVPLFLIALIFIPLQTSFEEYFFRGYLMQFIALSSKSKFLALFISSVIFGLMHISNPEVSEMGLVIMIFYIGCGLVLGIMTLMDGGLELALGFHAVNNLFGAVVLTTSSSVFQTDAIILFKGESSIIELLIQVFIIFPILLYIFSKKYNWKNWNQKLFKAM